MIPSGVLAWLQEAFIESDLTEQGARNRELKRLEEQHRRIDANSQTLYEDRLDGRITPETYDRKARDLQSQALDLLRRIDRIRATAPAPVQEAINVMELTSRAAELFAIQPAHEKQAFLRLVLKSASWAHGQLRTEFENPFESLRRSNQLNQTKHEEKRMSTAENEIWLPRNRGFQPPLRRIHAKRPA